MICLAIPAEHLLPLLLNMNHIVFSISQILSLQIILYSNLPVSFEIPCVDMPFYLLVFETLMRVLL